MKPEEKRRKQEEKMEKDEQRERINVHVSGKQRAVIQSALDTIKNEGGGKYDLVFG